MSHNFLGKMSEKSLLFIDPHPQDLENIFFLLGKKGFSITVADSWGKVLTAVKKQKPSLILLALIFPSCSGFEILRKLKKNRKAKQIPVLIFTYANQEIAWKKAIEMGAVGFLTKQKRPPSQVVEYILKVFEEVNNND